ncbi:signal peptidase I [Chondromyces apiculatus]|uniref:Signal peptidase I n=1 Tax=Chondromyces apiculatus DSM 436 TaxID=1192034 RepID=A0A017SZL0_9BACT|nr:signal peptidase I [Chondromyces apiculatus]EYF02408.1 Signal peptidase I [Chondromyces apiculatus DSM 436]
MFKHGGPGQAGELVELTALVPSSTAEVAPVEIAAPPSVRSRMQQWLPGLRWIATRAVALALFLTLLRTTVADQYHVPTSSMWPTIAPGDRIFVYKLAYGVRLPFTSRYLMEAEDPHPGDVVVFSDPRGGAVPLVKRVVAVAGQTVAVQSGVLLIDGVPQTVEVLGDGQMLEHLGPTSHAAGSVDLAAFGPVVVPPDHVFMMGDNRASSLDSREIGSVPRQLIRGRVVGVLYHHREGEGLDAGRLLQAIDARPDRGAVRGASPASAATR